MALEFEEIFIDVSKVKHKYSFHKNNMEETYS